MITLGNCPICPIPAFRPSATFVPYVRFLLSDRMSGLSRFLPSDLMRGICLAIPFASGCPFLAAVWRTAHGPLPIGQPRALPTYRLARHGVPARRPMEVRPGVVPARAFRGP